MKSPLIRALGLGLSLTLAAQAGHAAATGKTAMPAEKKSLIEKALYQQKNESKLQSDDNLKVLTALKAAPTQSFFASQNQSFTRFVQSLFLQNNS
ncbi:hypothetical protein [Acinetobacter sp.]|jgi:hypothetical protein|uniref:hypothetical protein n=1 Tax=Acinetobacter sp. TaxID=472 RepID=UPI0035AF39D3